MKTVQEKKVDKSKHGDGSPFEANVLHIAI